MRGAYGAAVRAQVGRPSAGSPVRPQAGQRADRLGPEIPRLTGMDVRLSHRGLRPGQIWTPVTRGVQSRTDAADPVRASLAAWLLALPAGTCFTHVTGAALLDLWLPALHDRADVVVQLPPGAHQVRRPGLRAIRGAQCGPPTWVNGLPVASVPDVLLSLCRDLGELDALVAVDSALNAQVTTVDELQQAAHSRSRRGAPRLRKVLRWADGRAESPWETLLREFHRMVEAPVTPQWKIFDEGQFVARGDLRLDGTRVIHEYDGEIHRSAEQHAADLRRDRRLLDAGWTKRAYTSRDLVRQAGSVLADIDRSLGRPHDRSRVREWHELIRTSAVATASGRRLLWERLEG